jgi:hypothetical protein
MVGEGGVGLLLKTEVDSGAEASSNAGDPDGAAVLEAEVDAIVSITILNCVCAPTRPQCWRQSPPAIEVIGRGWNKFI